MDFVLKYLVGWLQERKTDQAAIDRFVHRWRRLRHHDSRLCPRCYLDEKVQNNEQPLAAMAAHSGVEPLFCPHCKTTFDVPEPGR